MTKHALRRLLFVNRVLAGCRSVTALLDSLKRIVSDLFPTASGYAVVSSPDLPRIVGIGFGAKSLELQLVASQILDLDRKRAPHNVCLLQSEQVRSLFSDEVRFAAFAQILNGDDRVGCLVTSVERPNSEVIELVDLVAQQAGVHIHNAILNDLATEQLCRFADYDTVLTHLPNRTAFRRRLRYLVEGARSGERLSVGFVDLDNFNRVNRSIGHFAADQLIRQIAERWSGIIALKGPEAMLARIGGDEFALILPGYTYADSAALVSCLLESLRVPMTVDDREFKILASAGLCSFPCDAESVEGILKAAEKAMFCAKDSGGNRYCLFADLARHAKLPSNNHPPNVAAS